MAANENQIVVYQPNETVRLDVRLENETVWLTQSQMATLFGCSTDNIGLHLKNVYAVGELSREATTEDFSVVRKVFWTGASLKDAGRLTFAAAKMGPEIIPGLLASISKATAESVAYPTDKSAASRSRRSGRMENR